MTFAVECGVYWQLTSAAGVPPEEPDPDPPAEEDGVGEVPPAEPCPPAEEDAEGEADVECVGLAEVDAVVCGMAASCGEPTICGASWAAAAEPVAAEALVLGVCAPVCVAAAHPASSAQPMAMGRTLLTTRPGSGNCLRLAALSPMRDSP